LRCDYFRCALTGALDVASITNGSVEWDQKSQPVQTAVAHIIPDAILTSVSGQNAGAPKGIVAATLLRCFGMPVEPSINPLENIVTMERIVHANFCNLDLWLQPPECVHAA